MVVNFSNNLNILSYFNFCKLKVSLRSNMKTEALAKCKKKFDFGRSPIFFCKISGLPAADIVVYSLGGTPPAGVKFGFFSTLIVAVGFSLSLEETPLLLLLSPK